jgi:hypothetical protein
MKFKLWSQIEMVPGRLGDELQKCLVTRVTIDDFEANSCTPFQQADESLAFRVIRDHVDELKRLHSEDKLSNSPIRESLKQIVDAVNKISESIDKEGR